ncbi:MAG: glycosyltransferase [Gemmatimonadota bacterium]
MVRERLHCLPNAWGGFGTDAVGRQEARSRLGVPADTFHVGFVGRVDRVKGADVFVEALGRLAGDPAFVASVIGTGPAHASLQARAAELGVADRIIWHGHVPEAGRWFSAFDVYVLSSRTEGSPIALLEAMAANVPVVATRVGGVPHVVSEREALLVAPEHPDQLAAAIRHVRNDPAAARDRALAARSRLDADFSLDVWVRRYDGVYKDALASVRQAVRHANVSAG